LEPVPFVDLRAQFAAIREEVEEAIAGVLERGGRSPRAARRQAQVFISAMEGALILARLRQSTRPILDVGKLLDE